MAWTVWSCDTVTGEKQARLPVAAFSWERVLNGGGSGSAKLLLSDPSIRWIDVAGLVRVASRTLVLEWDGVVVYAGIVTGHDYDGDKRTLTISHSDLWWILDRRLAADFSVADTAAAQRVYQSLSLGTIAKRQVQLGIAGPANDNAVLPISFAADVAGSTGKRTYYGYHFTMVAAALDLLIAEDKGPDIDFQPRWVNDRLNWLMRTGTPASPSLKAGSYEWNVAAEKSGVSDLTVKLDANKLVTAAYALGEGQGVDGLYRSNRVVNPAYPTLQRVESYSQEDDNAVLFGRANADLQAYRYPTEQWSCTVRADGSPAVSALLLGGAGRFYFKGDPFIADGWHDQRIIQFSGDLTNKVSLDFQTDRGD